MNSIIRWTVVQCLVPGLFGGAVFAQESASVTTVTSDDVRIHGQTYFGSLDDDAPLILLFHQGGSSGRGEYAALIPWLNAAGFRAIAWDARRGGDLHGSPNRTTAGLSPNAQPEFCEAYPDLVAALEYVTSHNLAPRVVVWGSSYTAALVFQLAAENPNTVAALLAFSPPTGEPGMPMRACRVGLWIDQLTVPGAVFRPRSEMGFETISEQRARLVEAGVEFVVIEDGIHGSSMLVDERTGHDMATARRLVMQWLEGAWGRRPSNR